MLLNSHMSASARCIAEKLCGVVRFIWGTSRGEDPLGARDKILNTNVVRRTCAGRAPGARRANIPPQLRPGLSSLRVRSAATVICGIIIALDSSEP